MKINRFEGSTSSLIFLFILALNVFVAARIAAAEESEKGTETAAAP